MICKNCCRKIVAYEHPLTIHVVKLIQAIAQKGGFVDVFWIRQQGWGNNTTIAKYFGLLENTADRKWQLTDKGWEFAREGCQIPNWVRQYDGEVYEESPELISLKDVVETVPYKKIDPSEDLLNKRREELFHPSGSIF